MVVILGRTDLVLLQEQAISLLGAHVKRSRAHLIVRIGTSCELLPTRLVSLEEASQAIGGTPCFPNLSRSRWIEQDLLVTAHDGNVVAGLDALRTLQQALQLIELATILAEVQGSVLVGSFCKSQACRQGAHLVCTFLKKEVASLELVFRESS